MKKTKQIVIQRKNQPFERIGDAVAPMLSLIPGVGGSLATIWGQWDINQRFSRVEDFLKELSKNIEVLGDTFKAENIGDSEMRLLEETIKRITCEHRTIKRKRFASLLTTTWTERKDRPFEENMTFVRALDEFDEIHIKILVFLKNAGRKHPAFQDIGLYLEIREGDYELLLLPALDRLASGYGFIKRCWKDTGPKLLNTQNFSPEGIARKCEHIVTEAGSEFLNSIITN